MSISTEISALRARSSAGRYPYDVDLVRVDFPILSRRVHRKPLVYLDSAATSQKPRQVIDKMSAFYRHYNATRTGGSTR